MCVTCLEINPGNGITNFRIRNPAAAAVHRAAFDNRMSWLAGLHTLEEDRRYFRECVFQDCEVWGALEGGALIGVVGFREDWIDQLYVLPNSQRRGIGTALLDVAKSAFLRLHL
jgi:putative acetyltransferase